MSQHDPRPTLIVTGLGRCGTSALMQALHAGGIPTVGEWPAFEPPETQPPIDPAWLAAQRGRAVKMLDPHRNPPPPQDAVIIRLRRDLAQQARSQLKMALTATGQPRAPTRAEAYGMVKLLRRDESLSSRALPPVALLLRFDDLVWTPGPVMQRVRRALARWWTLDADAAAAAIETRDPRCAPDLSREMAMIAAADARAHRAAPTATEHA